MSRRSLQPTFHPEELIAYCKCGVSFSCIGKKLGTDNTKGEVVSVFSVMKELENTLADVQELECLNVAIRELER